MYKLSILILFLLLSSIKGLTRSILNFRDPIHLKNGIFTKYQNHVKDTIIGIERDTIYERNKGYIKLACKELIFYSGVSFPGSVFLKEANFSNTIFLKNSNFNIVTYDDIANYFADSFMANVTYVQAIFKNKVNFQYAFFNNTISFSQAIFSNYLCLSSIKSSPSSMFIFDSATLPDIIDVSNNPNLITDLNFISAKFSNELRIDKGTNAYFNNKNHKIYTYNTNASKLHIDYYHFKILLQDPITGTSLTRDEAKTVYEAMLKNFKDRGQNDSYELLDIEYHDYLYGKWNFIRLWNSYGYHKEWVFRWIGIFILFFTIITIFLFNKLNKKIENGGVYNVSNIPEEVKVDSLRNFFRRIWYSLMYTSTIFFLLTLKIENINFRKPAILYLILVYSTGIICLGYLANFVLQK